MIALRVWQRADGWTEIEGPSALAFPVRFKSPPEVEAFLSGFRAAHRVIRESIRELDIRDDRPVEVAPAPAVAS